MFGKRYETAKVVRIKGWELKVAEWTVALAVTFYFVVYTMFYKGEHLQTFGIVGEFTSKIKPPTYDCYANSNLCSLAVRRSEDLPYCNNSNLPAIEKKPCAEPDMLSLINMLPDQRVRPAVPTRLMRFKRSFRGFPSAGSNEPYRSYVFVDANNSVQTSQWPEPVSDVFFEDIERYILSLRHAISLPGGDTFNGEHMNGFLLGSGGVSEELGCLPSAKREQHGKSPCRAIPPPEGFLALQKDRAQASSLSQQKDRTRASRAATQDMAISSNGRLLLPRANTIRVDHEPDVVVRNVTSLDVNTVVKTDKGDDMSFQVLLKLANVSMDGLDGDEQNYEKTVRSCGARLQITFEYSNFNSSSWVGLQITPWSGWATPSYTMKVERIPIGCWSRWMGDSHWYTKNGQAFDALKFRTVEVEIVQVGSFRKWSSDWAIVHVMACYALLQSAFALLGYVIEYSLGERFTRLKYEDHDPSIGV